jgi:xylan 1,4-beta-xylosidase
MPNHSKYTSASVTVDRNQRSPLRRIWRYVGYDEPNYTYTPNGQTLLTKLAEMSDGPYFVRCHFFLCSGDGSPALKWGSTNVYTEDEDRNPAYSWTLIDKILDSYVALGLIPFVELGFTPEALTTAPAGTVYDDPRYGGWRYPPREYGRWLELIRNLAAHCRERYGLAEVSKWYWELWNEPDIFYWTGTVEEFCRLYDYTEAGLHAVLPQARLGGPATTSSARRPESSQFLRSFLQHVTSGVNHLTGQIGTRIDFISYHAKGGSFPRDPEAAKSTPSLHTLLSNVEAGLDVIGDFPELGKMEVILSECDPDGWAAGTIHDNPNLQYRNTEYYASYVAGSVNQLVDRAASTGAQIDGMLTWAFLFEDRGYFEGFRTLSTNGIDKPVLNVFRLLAKLGGIRLALTSDRARDPVAQGRADSSDEPPTISGLAATDETAGIQVFLASHHDDWDATIASEVSVSLVGTIPGARYRVYRSMVARGSGNSYTAWEDMGSPPRPNAEQLAKMENTAKLKTEYMAEVMADTTGATIAVTLPSHSACLLNFVPVIE